MASTDAKPIPQKNVAYRVTFPIFDADGDLVTGATGLDSEISKDGGAFTDCTNEATEIATASGMYYLDLTNTEMNADTVAVIIKTSSSGAKTTPIVMYPEEAGDIRVNATQWNSLTTVALPLVPTVAGRSLDVSATGEAGLDWANIGSPTTAVNLSATNIDVDQVVASVSGAVGSVTGNVGGNVTGSVGSVTGLTNATIADAVWDEDATGHQTQGTFGQAIGDPVADTNSIYKAVVTDATGATVGIDVVAIKAETVSIQADTDNIQTRLPAALVSGRMDVSVGAMAADVLTAAATAADFTTEIQTGLATAANLSTLQTTANDILTDTAEIGVAGAGLTNINLPNQTMDIVGNITGNLSGSVGSVTGLTVATISDGVWDEALAGHLSAGSTGEALNAAGASGDPWTTALPGAYTAGQAGYIIGNNINAPLDTIDTVVDAIKAKTDSLTFTVAGQVDANAESMNGTEILGDGSSGNLWRG